MTSVIGRGLLAGAVGTTLLNAATYVDMLLTGRPASSAPGQTALASITAAGIDPADDANRVEAYGAVGGIAAGLGVGVLASTARRLGLRVSAPVGAVLTGLAAMAATDLPMAGLGVADPGTWLAADWARDLAPHLAYGVGVRLTLDATTPPAGEAAVLEPATGSLVGRSLVLGVATGARASLGLLGPALVGSSRPAAAVASVSTATELVLDKLPQAPSRLEVAGLGSRIASGALGGAALAAHESRRPGWPAVAGVLGAVTGSVVGSAWRSATADRGLVWQGAVVEDVVALSLVAAVLRRSRG